MLIKWYACTRAQATESDLEAAGKAMGIKAVPVILLHYMVYSWLSPVVSVASVTYIKRVWYALGFFDLTMCRSSSVGLTQFSELTSIFQDLGLWWIMMFFTIMNSFFTCPTLLVCTKRTWYPSMPWPPNGPGEDGAESTRWGRWVNYQSISRCFNQWWWFWNSPSSCCYSQSHRQ